ncbi:MAG: hypothetical protein E6344_19890 [Clostridium sp.]|uniref:hypothetical protein n=1 Tax=Clostridium culturomicium TaxID=1499683 RepID=UPI000590CAF8|nr:hypothetical protein [Clostridium culturomicium]MDU4892694.1 hypothetical protein [Clostridium sp.]MDU7085952.1 hypothetical protein [Clostridium sp.]
MKDVLVINSLIEKENEMIRSYENFEASMSGKEVSSLVEDSIMRHNNHVEALKKLSEEVR